MPHLHVVCCSCGMSYTVTTKKGNLTTLQDSWTRRGQSAIRNLQFCIRYLHFASSVVFRLHRHEGLICVLDCPSRTPSECWATTLQQCWAVLILCKKGTLQAHQAYMHS